MRLLWVLLALAGSLSAQCPLGSVAVFNPQTQQVNCVGGNGRVVTGGGASLVTNNYFVGRQDATGAQSTAPIKIGTTPPALCSPGDLFLRMDAPPGCNLHVCTTVNLWTQYTGNGNGSCGNIWMSWNSQNMTWNGVLMEWGA